MSRRTRPLKRLLISLAGLVLMFSISTLSNSAHASLTGCRSDPFVILSNGETVHMTSDIDDSVSDVKSIVYTLHAPIGTRVTSIVQTDGLLGLKEQFRFYADMPPQRYVTDAYVITGLRGVSVTTTSALTALWLGTASGRDRQHLTISLTK